MSYCQSKSPHRGLLCSYEEGHVGAHTAVGWGGDYLETWPQERIRVVHRTRHQRLISLSTGGSICIETVARILDCPEASIRRDIQQLRAQGWYIVLDQKQITNYGKRAGLIQEGR